jgi:hypothetical protein
MKLLNKISSSMSVTFCIKDMLGSCQAFASFIHIPDPAALRSTNSQSAEGISEAGVTVFQIFILSLETL